MRFKRRKLDTLRRWWCQLNCYEWPKDFPQDDKPDGPTISWSDDPRFRKAFDGVTQELAFRNVRDYWGDVWLKRHQK